MPPGIDHAGFWQPSYLNLDLALNKPPQEALQVHHMYSNICRARLAKAPPCLRGLTCAHKSLVKAWLVIFASLSAFAAWVHSPPFTPSPLTPRDPSLPPPPSLSSPLYFLCMRPYATPFHTALGNQPLTLQYNPYVKPEPYIRSRHRPLLPNGS